MMMNEYGWIWAVILLVHFLLGFMVTAIMGEKGYKGGFVYFLFGLLFGVFAFFCVIGMPISREEQAERDKELVRLMMEAQWVSAGQDNNENGRPNEDNPMGDTQAV